MKGYVFDPSRLACSPKEQERRGYEMVARMLRDYLGNGDIFAEVRRRVQCDPRLWAMLADANEVFALPPAKLRITAARRQRLRRAVDQIERNVIDLE